MGKWVTILVHIGIHHGREYVRLHRRNKHRTKGCWYPTKSFFKIPAEYAEGLADALRAAARGTPVGDDPEWLLEFRAAYAARVAAQDREDVSDQQRA